MLSDPNLLNPEAIEWPLTAYLYINMVKYDADQEITNAYENLQIVQIVWTNSSNSSISVFHW